MVILECVLCLVIYTENTKILTRRQCLMHIARCGIWIKTAQHVPSFLDPGHFRSMAHCYSRSLFKGVAYVSDYLLHLDTAGPLGFQISGQNLGIMQGAAPWFRKFIFDTNMTNKPGRALRWIARDTFECTCTCYMQVLLLLTVMCREVPWKDCFSQEANVVHSRLAQLHIITNTVAPMKDYALAQTTQKSKAFGSGSQTAQHVWKTASLFVLRMSTAELGQHK